MSEDISENDKNMRSTDISDESQSSKRRRRSGWDIQAPVDVTSTTPLNIGGGVSSVSIPNALTSSTATTPFIPPTSSLLDPAFLLQQAQLAQLAQQNQVNQQLLLAQQQALLIQNRVMNPLLGGMQTQMPKQGCRIYIG